MNVLNFALVGLSTAAIGIAAGAGALPDPVFPPWPLFSAFLIASLVLAVTPGPGVLYIVARSLAQGRRSGLVSVAGVALGNLGNALAAALGLAALFAVSATAFAVVRYAGALYLAYLGVRMLQSARAGISAAPPTQPAPLGRIFRDGFVVALLNPKSVNTKVTVFVSIVTNQHSEEWLRRFAELIREFPEVVEFYRMSGQVDYLLRVVVPDIEAYDAFYKRLIAKIEISDVSSAFAMEQIKYTTALPLSYIQLDKDKPV